eukprot:SAG31_NODE_4316_length_3363_cov_11.868862_5_plen_35_part_00
MYFEVLHLVGSNVDMYFEVLDMSKFRSLLDTYYS